MLDDAPALITSTVELDRQLDRQLLDAKLSAPRFSGRTSVSRAALIDTGRHRVR